MSEKSHVGMEARICQVCGKQYDTGNLLLDKRLRESLDRVTVTGWGLCVDDEQKLQDDYVALVEVANDGGGSTLTQETADRTGRIAHLKRDVFSDMFDAKLPSDLPMVFVGPGVLDQLEKRS